MTTYYQILGEVAEALIVSDAIVHVEVIYSGGTLQVALTQLSDIIEFHRDILGWDIKGYEPISYSIQTSSYDDNGITIRAL